MICDRTDAGQTCEAVQFDGTNAEALRALAGETSVLFMGDRLALVNPERTVYTFLDSQDWVVRGVGPDWDFYVVRSPKFLTLWTPRP